MAAGELVRYVTRHDTRRLARLVFVAPPRSWAQGRPLLLTQGAGHGLYHTHAHQLADAILDFAETPSPAG